MLLVIHHTPRKHPLLDLANLLRQVHLSDVQLVEHEVEIQPQSREPWSPGHLASGVLVHEKNEQQDIQKVEHLSVP